MKNNSLVKQRGSTIFLSLVFMIGLFTAIGMGTDTGHWMVNKARLQNGLDSASLSAAITLLNDINRNTAAATTQGRATFDLFKATSGNNELSTVSSNSLTFQYSSTLTPFNPGSAPPNFVRVTTNALQVAPILIRMLPAFQNPINVSARSTAGAVGQNCSLTPFVLCADMTPLDTNCADDSNGDGNQDCYGYEIGETNDLIIPCLGNGNCPPATNLESGNFHLLDLAGQQGGADIRNALCNNQAVNICTNGNILNTKPGLTWGPVRQGIDCRFNSDTQTFQYPFPAPTPSPFTDYSTNASGHGVGNNRREMAAPIGDCRGLQNGNSNFPLVGYACLFLTEKSIQQGPNKIIRAEFTGAFCPQAGAWSVTNPTLNGPFRVVNFKHEGSGDS